MILLSKPILFLKGCAISLLATLCFSSVQAATLVQYSFTSNATTAIQPQILAPTINASNLSVAGALTAEWNYGLGVYTNATGSNAAGNVLRLTGISTAALNTSSSQYLEFVVTPTSAINLQQISFDYGVGGTGTRLTQVLYSFDNFATAGKNAGITTTPAGTTSFYHADFVLENQNVGTNSTTSPITFRYYFATPGTGSDFRMDNITLIGVVPEPSLPSLSAVAFAAFCLRRTRSK